jgi:hypothetical protein
MEKTKLKIKINMNPCFFQLARVFTTPSALLKERYHQCYMSPVVSRYKMSALKAQVMPGAEDARVEDPYRRLRRRAFPTPSAL